MGNYRAQYEKYYGSVKGKTSGSKKRGQGYGSNGKDRAEGPQQLAGKLLKKIMWQLVGALVLVLLVLVIKMIPLEGTKEAYIVSKEMIDQDFDISETVMAINIEGAEGYKEQALDYIDEIKSLVVGDKTLKEKIKEDYVVPTLGTIKMLDDTNIGIAILTDGDKDIAAAFDGTVTEVKEEADGGEKHLIIDHGNGIETYYGLLSSINVKEGDVISKGENLGKSGVIDSSNTKGVVFKIIYMGLEKDPNDLMDLSSLQKV
ncbi:M23 family metallopeptidase [Clostridium vincentii]|uniref:Peptidase family M23 n=1 Tax=Clostridium vincentii TaxID=52704 RepID=A0A2T0BEW9_9CLOT|nr:M23 family metallopeptidase [Clostridium vincentii]PRR82435.1 Peptidase family M23 [Clostridium vincentii]